jgi:hypothetical protein
LPEAKLTEPLLNPPTDDDYRELAVKIREIARQTRLPVARRELVRLAASYETRGAHLDRRTNYENQMAMIVHPWCAGELSDSLRLA